MNPSTPTQPQDPAPSSTPPNPALNESINPNLPAARPPEKKPRKWIAILIIAGLPLAFLLYKLISGGAYTPSIRYSQDSSKAAKKLEELKPTIAQKLSDVDTDIVLATNTARDTPPTPTPQPTPRPTTTSSTSTPSPESSSYTYKLTKYGKPEIQNVCRAITRYGGSKFDQHAVGQRMSCTYGVQQLYVWDGSREAIGEVVQQLSSKYTESEASNWSTTPTSPASDLKIYIDYTKDVSLYESKSLLSGDTPDWQKILPDTTLKGKYDVAAVKEPGYKILITAQEEYYVFFDRML